MNFTEIVILDYINIDDEQVHLFIHTKDQRVLGLRDILSNPVINYNAVYVDHMVFGKRFTFAMAKEDFSHVEYYTEKRPDSRQEFDDVNSFIDEQIEEFRDKEDPPEVLREP